MFEKEAGVIKQVLMVIAFGYYRYVRRIYFCRAGDDPDIGVLGGGSNELFFCPFGSNIRRYPAVFGFIYPKAAHVAGIFPSAVAGLKNNLLALNIKSRSLIAPANIKS